MSDVLLSKRIDRLEQRITDIEKHPQPCGATCAFVMEFRHMERREDRHVKSKAIIFEQLEQVKMTCDAIIQRELWVNGGQEPLRPSYEIDCMRRVIRHLESIQLLCDMGDPESVLLRKEAEKEERIRRQFAEEACS